MAIINFTHYPDVIHGLMCLAFLLIGVAAAFARYFALGV
jgi:hypothetical protein